MTTRSWATAIQVAAMCALAFGCSQSASSGKPKSKSPSALEAAATAKSCKGLAAFKSQGSKYGRLESGPNLTQTSGGAAECVLLACSHWKNTHGYRVKQGGAVKCTVTGEGTINRL